MSFGRRRGYSRASATRPTCPPRQCLRVASYAIGTPSTSNMGDQVRIKQRTWATRGSFRLSTELDLLFLWSCDCLGCLLPLEWPNSPSSVVSICLFSLDRGWVSTQDQQESEGEEKEEDLLGAWTCSCLKKRAPYSCSS